MKSTILLLGLPAITVSAVTAFWFAQTVPPTLIAATIAAHALIALWHVVRRRGRRSAETNSLLRAVFENSAVGLAQVDAFGAFKQVNGAFLKLVGRSEETMPAPDFRLKDILTSEKARENMSRNGVPDCGRDNRCVFTEHWILPDDNEIWVNLFIDLVRGKWNEPTSFVIAAVDITPERRADQELEQYRRSLEQRVEERTQALQKSERRFRFIAENSHDVIWTMDLRTNKFTYVSPSVLKQRGFTPDEVMRDESTDALTEESAERVREIMEDIVSRWNQGERDQTVRITETAQPHKDGRLIQTEQVISLHPDESGNLVSALGVTRDITERKRAEEAIRHLAFYDGLTDLPNRRLLRDRLRQTLSRAERDGSRTALLFVDLDEFKSINDELGHQAGDALLKTAAKRMTECLREYDTAARIGGDEFIILLPDLDHIEDAFIVAERVRAALSRPFVDEHEQPLNISASIGVALYPDHADNERDLLRVGDEAMYRAKRSGRNKVEVIPSDALPLRIESGSPSEGTSIRLTWRPVLASGHTQIDAEHRNLFRSANRLLNAAMTPPPRRSEIAETLDDLFNELILHFHHEEEILRNTGYKDLPDHVAKHRVLMNRAFDLRKQAERDNFPIRDLVLFLTVDIIADHMLHDDRAFFETVAPRN